MRPAADGESMRILLVEDDQRLAQHVANGLRENGCAVDLAGDGIEGAYLAQAEAYDVVVLDIMLPGQSGIEVIRQVRRKGVNVPILCLTARDTLADRVLGLDLGADDYLVKPFRFAELLARLRALHRRSPHLAPVKLRCGDLVLDPNTREVHRAGQPISLTPKEFSLLEYLMRRMGAVVTRTAIIESLWDMNFDSLTNVVDVFVSHLRAKVDRPFKTRLIHTVRGAGYLMKSEGE